ncbi:hypothetical protein JAAARDRAFT_39512, partial [Jaapia argillacea MUCL 33604]
MFRCPLATESTSSQPPFSFGTLAACSQSLTSHAPLLNFRSERTRVQKGYLLPKVTKCGA